MPWSVGRAIDAEVLLRPETGKAYLYFATRDPSMTRQLIGLAESDIHSSFGAGTWKDMSTDGPIFAPVLPWEELCIEAPTVIKHGSTYFMFYAGAYNNRPQQIGVASSPDAIHWTRLSSAPFLLNGAPGAWNSSESGHPGVLETKGKIYLFYQGNDDHGKTYFLSMVPIFWKGGRPVLSEGSSVQEPDK
jgi:beta-1,2-mannobiose phosphorylase / 1,2-beta-oligomannan phosphorylase